MYDSTTATVHNFRNLWVLEAVAVSGGINRAARELRLSQPAVTRIVRLVESDLGCRLFHRTGSGTLLTEPGELFFKRVRRAIHHLSLAQRLIGQNTLVSLRNNEKMQLHHVVKHRHFKVLLNLVDAKNMSVAARSMNITQPAVHRCIKELEVVLNLEIFERRYRQLVLTRAGEILVHHLKLAATELRYCVNELSAQSGPITGHVRIGILPLLQTVLIPQVVNNLSCRYPGLRFSIFDAPYENLLADLRSGELDVLVGALRSPPPANDVTETMLLNDQLTVVARAGHKLVHRQKVSIAELAQAKWVAPLRATLIRGYFDRLFERNDLNIPDDVIESSSTSLMRALLLESDRLAIVSRSRIHYEIKTGLLTPLKVELPDNIREIGITVRSEADFPPAVLEFVNTLVSFAPTEGNF